MWRKLAGKTEKISKIFLKLALSVFSFIEIWGYLKNSLEMVIICVLKMEWEENTSGLSGVFFIANFR